MQDNERMKEQGKRYFADTSEALLAAQSFIGQEVQGHVISETYIYPENDVEDKRGTMGKLQAETIGFTLGNRRLVVWDPKATSQLHQILHEDFSNQYTMTDVQQVDGGITFQLDSQMATILITAPHAFKIEPVEGNGSH